MPSSLGSRDLFPGQVSHVCNHPVLILILYFVIDNFAIQRRRGWPSVPHLLPVLCQVLHHWRHGAGGGCA